MSELFTAEALIRAAASGAIPATGEVLIRTDTGWVFGLLNFESIEGELDPDQIDTVPFTKVSGIAARGQLPAEIAYEDEVNIFVLSNTFQGQIRRGIRTISSIASPYVWQEDDWHLNVDASGGRVIVQVPDAADHFDVGFTDQLHFKKIGSGSAALELVPVVKGQLIDGFADVIIRQVNRSFTLVSDGTNWWVQ